jgi:hypothetical protein
MEAHTILSDVRAEMLNKFGVAAYAFNHSPTQLLCQTISAAVLSDEFLSEKGKGYP